MVGTTPPPLQGPSSKEKKYDRQLRLWAANGQAALEQAHVLLVNSGPGVVGIETLKNLVLPGIGNFTILDEATVTDSDLGVNFFLDQDSLGLSRASRCCELLEELNPDVHGHYITEPVEAFLNKLDSLKPYTLILLTPYVGASSLKSIYQYTQTNSIPTFYLHSVGFYSRFSLSLPAVFPIVDTHPDPTTTTDLRLLNPWPELTDLMLEKTSGLDARSGPYELEDGTEPKRNGANYTMSDHEHGHVPYVLLLLHYLEEWRKIHNGKNPQNYREKKDFEGLVKSGARANNPEGGEENYDEAVGTILKSLNPPTLNSAVREILEADECRNIVKESPNFWIIASAIRSFFNEHSELPLPGLLPDMKAQSADYIRLQNVYKLRARKDVAEVLATVRRTETSLGRIKDPIAEKEVEAFCKGASFVKLVRGRPQYTCTETAKRWGDRAQFAWQELKDGESQMSIYLAFLALETAHEEARESEDEPVERIAHVAREIILGLRMETSSEESTDAIEARVRQVIQEMVRAGNGELHNISALTGGMVAQEVIKVLTKQYAPIDSNCVFDGISGRTSVFRL